MSPSSASADIATDGRDSSGDSGNRDGRQSANRSLTILVVEDEPDVAHAMADVLRDEGYDVLVAGHGKEALDLLRHHAVHLILLDLRLPVMDGWRFRTIQRSQPSLSHIPVIAVSADGSAQAEAIDANEYLHKPLQRDQLVLSVERVLLADRRKRLDDQLREAGLLTTLGTLAATVGHEINNPLTYVLGNLQILEKQLAPAVQSGASVGAEVVAGMSHLLRDVRTGAERIREVVSTLQNLSRTSDVPTAPVDIARVAQTSSAMAKTEIRHRARLRMDLEPVPPVLGNEVQLGQVVLNLLINAAQSIPPGAYERNEIRVATYAAAGGEVVIEVADTGVGIPPELQPRVFDPFFTTRGRLEGTGIGLTVCRNIVQEHGGRIELSSQPGAGTTFRVFLPVQPSGHAKTTARSEGALPATDDPAIGASNQGVPVATTDGRSRVLVIDDEPLVLSTMVRILSKEHEVQGARSAREALAILAAEPMFEAIVCDAVMPEMTGMEFASELEKRHRGAGSRIVFVTGAALVRDVLAFRARSPNTWLDKPFTVEALLEAVRATIRKNLQIRHPGI
jgi:signal transduction histidine kinase